LAVPAKKKVNIVDRASGEVLLQGARWCSSYLCKLRGLQYRRRLNPGEALVLVHSRDSAAATSIHMFSVFFSIAAVWVNGVGEVTHTALARPWRPYYASPHPARYVIEAEPDFLNRVKVGDRLDFLPLEK
jgi:uncharacterized membrane protein (UPF0127 family)